MTTGVLSQHGATLLSVAATSIDHGLLHGRPRQVRPEDHPVALGADGASFVTLHRAGVLRGCIGSPEAYRPLVVDVSLNGFAAAFEDPRFPPLQKRERADLELSVSVLSPPTPMTVADEPDLLRQLRPGVDGLILQEAHHRALFLPAVWEGLPDPPEFVEHLKAKAGLPREHWSARVKAWRFTADEISAPWPDAVRAIIID